MNEQGRESMRPFVGNTLCCELANIPRTKMPRVVPDQRDKFEHDELFRKLSHEGEIKYTGFRDKPQEERQLRFETDCREGHADIAFVATGTTLQLSFASNAWSDKPEDRKATSEFVNFDREPGKICDYRTLDRRYPDSRDTIAAHPHTKTIVHLKSQFIMNGVCVIWRGWMDLRRLDGIGCLEFDSGRAEVEDALLREQADQYNRRIRDYEERQRQFREDEEERRVAAEAEVHSQSSDHSPSETSGSE